jgi:tetratricopeptide (TPR) repeat protein
MSKVFAERAGEPIAAGEEEAVRTALDEHRKARATRDGDRYAAQFNFHRMIAEAETTGGLPPRDTRESLERTVKSLRSRFANCAAIEEDAWVILRVVRVEFVPGRGEAVVVARLRTFFRAEEKWRFWLIKDSGRWTVFDWEAVRLGIRASATLPDVEPILSELPGFGLKRAEEMFHEGRTEEALREIDTTRGAGMLLGSVYPAAELLEIQCYEKLRRHAHALRVVDALLAKHPASPALHSSRGRMLLALRRHDEALAAHREALRLLGDDAEAWSDIARTLEEMGREPEARDARRKCSAAEDLDELYEKGLALARENRATDALPLLLRACTMTPQSERMFECGCDRIERTGAGRELLDLADAFAKRWPASERAPCHRGIGLARLGRLDEAERALREGMKAAGAKRESACWPALAQVLAMAGRHDEALAFADKWADLTASTGDASAWWPRLVVNARRKSWDAARLDLELVLHADASWAPRVEHDAWLVELLKRPECAALLRQAETDWVRAAEALIEKGDTAALLILARSKAGGRARYYVGLALSWLGRHDEAETELLAGLPLSPPDLKFRYFEVLAQVTGQLGRYPEAHGYADRVAALSPLHTGIADLLHASIHAWAGEKKEALRSVRACLERWPTLHDDVEREPALRSIRGEPEYAEILRRARERAGAPKK